MNVIVRLGVGHINVPSQKLRAGIPRARLLNGRAETQTPKLKVLVS